MDIVTTMQKTFSASDLNKNVGDVLEAASRGPIGITRYGKTRFVIASVDFFKRLQGRKDTRSAYRVEDIPEDLLDALLESNADLLKNDG